VPFLHGPPFARPRLVDEYEGANSIVGNSRKSSTRGASFSVRDRYIATLFVLHYHLRADFDVGWKSDVRLYTSAENHQGAQVAGRHTGITDLDDRKANETTADATADAATRKARITRKATVGWDKATAPNATTWGKNDIYTGFDISAVAQFLLCHRKIGCVVSHTTVQAWVVIVGRSK